MAEGISDSDNLNEPAASKRRPTAARFGIGEWYGKSFLKLSPEERREYATYGLVHLDRRPETPRKCPFKKPTDKEGSDICTKEGGICSLRLYEPTNFIGSKTRIAKREEVIDLYAAQAVTSEEGDLRATCPHRFEQDDTIYKSVSQYMLGTEEPLVLGEIRFLQRETNAALDAPTDEPPTDPDPTTNKEDVGNIDNVLAHPTAKPLLWTALEIQSVYFSGDRMQWLFEHIRDFPTNDIPFPDGTRRPDYRSSGPKRLMPQLQIKVPSLRRWGKKMSVVVDAAWFRINVIKPDTVSDVSNSDIAWFIIEYNEKVDPPEMVIGPPKLQTLERAIESLTGGKPVTKTEFESKVQVKIDEILNPPQPPTRRRRKN
jgi:hypothetical protein